MMHSILGVRLLLVLFFACELCLAQIVTDGVCANAVDAISNFDESSFLGTWYELERTPSLSGIDGGCASLVFTLSDTSIVITKEEILNGELGTTSAIAVSTNINGSAIYEVTVPVNGVNYYYVLSTDYQNYALVYSCSQPNETQRQVSIMKLSRGTSIDSNVDSELNIIIDNIEGVTSDQLIKINQSSEACEINPPGAIVLAGQCDDTIQAVPDFNVSLYSGLWYQIEAYPSEYLTGTCKTESYEVSSEIGLSVTHTQVTQQALNILTGSAFIASSDGSGKLIMTFVYGDEGFGVLELINYWVLSTDYNNYALVYACRNLDISTKQIYSWKLSRESSLSSTSSATIDSVIDTLEVLDNTNYVTVGHTEDDCFYLPDYVNGDPVILDGQCDETISVVQDFNVEAYLGQWYDIESYPTFFATGACPSALYTLNDDGSVNVFNTQVLNETLDTITGTAYLDSDDGSAKLLVSFPGSPTLSPYWVLSTDYVSYSLVYSCTNIGDTQKSVAAWKLSRTRNLTSESEEAINQIVSSITVLNDIFFQVKDHSESGCFYYPDLAAGDYVEFSGQCDQSIQAQADIDLLSFAGTWYEIEAYPSPFVSGSCGTTEYTYDTNTNTLQLIQSNVDDTLLNATNGIAVVSSDDGSGKLLIALTYSSGELYLSALLDYWILSTDYVNYALAYSCINISSDRRRVYSWKLSRDKILSEETINSINLAIDDVNVLNDIYYQEISHSDEDCFYYPAAVTGEPVLFPGQCDDDINVVADFNLPAFTGVWYEIYGYPRFSGDTTSCVIGTVTESTLNVSSIYNQYQNVISGNIFHLASDGKLIITSVLDGIARIEDLWILATDYTSYALVYSCENVSPYFRRITSSKLSRTTSLSTAAETAINTVIDTVNVLSDDYYEEKGHTVDDCFFYPENNGGAVILLGQCDEDDINVVTDFDASRYTGLWHEVARYPTDFEFGECANALYETNEAIGGVDVTNTIVYNEQLYTISGQAVLVDDNGSGIHNVTLTGFDGTDQTSKYYILDTDYDEFALVYSCRNIDDASKQVYSWKLSRSKDGLSASANERIDAIVSEKRDLYEYYYSYTKQDDASCFYYPPYSSSDAINIILPGPCNQTITALPNFDVERYTGRWYEIARYPQIFQSGECASAQYTLRSDGILDVVNSLVNGQTLEKVEGYAVASSNGSALLEVTLPIPGTNLYQTTNLYILNTDYDNYALAYSCRDLEDGTRQVSSWKLSRTKTLSAESNLAIDTIVEQTQGLIESYYRYTDQADDACFYLPQVDTSAEVIFTGQCSSNLPVVSNFNIINYLGNWYEIEHYPTGYDSGACIESLYQQVNGVFNTLNTSVFGDTGISSSNPFTVDSNGVISKTLSNGQVVDYHVLATDYNTYSIIYNCENVDEYSRRVWSAKLSRTKEISSTANTALSTIIDSVDVLVDEFFVSVDHSYDACFYYPTNEGTSPVVLYGQCDTSLTGANNFNAVNFSGIWYLTSAYPASGVSGECISVYVSHKSDGTLSATILQVVDDDILETSISGDDSGIFTDQNGETVTILITDESYALAYSCKNIGQYNRQISFWKLSRTFSMSPSGNTAINELMNELDVLYEPYFISVSNNEECPVVASSTISISGKTIITLVLAVTSYLCLY